MINIAREVSPSPNIRLPLLNVSVLGPLAGTGEGTAASAGFAELAADAGAGFFSGKAILDTYRLLSNFQETGSFNESMTSKA